MAAPRTPTEALANLLSDARFGAGFLQRHGWRLVLVFVGLLLPLWGFAELADEVLEGEPFAFDEPILLFAREAAAGGLDQLFLLASKLGYEWGVVPVDILLVLGLALARRHREGLFAGVALLGSALLNMAAKLAFARERPTLWEAIAPEHTFSFPSGHAMGSMTLAMVLVLLCWHTRWRWPVLVAMLGFVLLVGLSRVYLGVHYPSDILAGWTAALAWTAATWLLVKYGAGRVGRKGLPPPLE
ncbi:phosphatase PAP2 family protein [Luteimonas sp. MC1782]|uniref:phosphatase PAP2 family protein n=1 Tax=Luteimonas sp. MC1782 TaxID=2760305 RepID=UPI0015FEF329|nr:phosphatase PAP2 family protein [Luteimonas sp. MC1782]MBB1471561.1 phosphatase PAP2 family protein [Luteimonas sp. MC1782]